MKRREMDSFSMTSGTSKTSREKQKTSRFSLRCMNPFLRRQSSSARSVRSIRSNSEIETRSISSSQNSNSEKEASEDAMSASLTGRSTPQHTMECPLCLSQHADTAFPLITTCHHRSCRDCLRQYLRIEIMESRVNIACPECAEKFHPNDIQRILDDLSLVRKYEEFMLRRILVSEPDARWCPAPDCGYAVIASGCASCPKLKCERDGCETYFCYHCKQYWHPNQTCDAARAERTSNMRSASISYSHESGSQSDIKPCPRCGAFIIKMDDGSCNHMTCAVCGAEFCWLCMKEISDLHYLSPSGCTFWGKKPWSRKKKILWQLGTLVGAPVGIGLVAGIAVPAMVIGIPVWVGRKLHTKYEHASKHKRNLVITGGVSASILISPVLAGLAVGIGVPILLAYVYGVVPISLCRSGGCGVTTTNSGGVRFEFEEDNETTVGVSGPYTGVDSQGVETASHNVANPSIGPSIGEMSVAMTNSLSASGSHMERAGLMRDESDRDSASNRALIGTSLSGSLSGSAVAGPSGFLNRLEVQADVANQPAKRNSLSSESANLSLDAKSATVSWGDDASTKALAGSICTRDKDNVSAVVPPLEVQVDVLNSSARYRHGSGSSNPANPPGSPGSSRSAGGVSEDGRPRRYWRQSRSVGERLHEHAERREQTERLSVHSFSPDAVEEDAEMGACGGVPDLRSPTGPTAMKGTASRGSQRHSVSFECVTSRAGSRSPGGELPEVESDKPSLCAIVTRQHSDERSQTVVAQKCSKKSTDKNVSSKPFRKLSWKKTFHKNPISP